MHNDSITPSGASIRLYWVVAAALSGMLILAAVVAPAIGVGIYMTSGVWAALAVDLANGTFYRPIVSEMGYGGTRYFPVHFAAHAGLIRLTENPVAAAYAIAYFAGLFLLAGTYRCLRKLDVPSRLAAPCAMLSLSALTVSVCLYQLRPDILATAFNIWGLSFCLRPGRRRWIAVAALFFTLAFMTKFTTVFGVVAVALHWFATGRRKEALTLAGTWSALGAIALLFVHLASEGRALESFLSCATGGSSPFTLLKGSYRFFYTPRIDVVYLFTFVVAASLAAKGLRSGFRDLPLLFFGLTIGATAVITADPGAGLNHFIDLQIASTILVALQVARPHTGRLVRYALPAAGIVGTLIIGLSVIYAQFYFPETRYEHQSRIIELTGDSGGPLLSDDPWIPILEGETPYVLDNYALRVIGEHDPSIAEDLFTKLDNRFFRAAVLFYGNQAPRGPNRNVNVEDDARRLYYGWMLYPEGFYERLTLNYAPIEFIGDYLVLLPR